MQSFHDYKDTANATAALSADGLIEGMASETSASPGADMAGDGLG